LGGASAHLPHRTVHCHTPRGGRHHRRDRSAPTRNSWPDLRLAVELDGSHHGRPPDRAADARQDQALQAAGYETLRFTDDDVCQRPRQILRALNAYR
jgi:hypothetical protein